MVERAAPLAALFGGQMPEGATPMRPAPMGPAPDGMGDSLFDGPIPQTPEEMQNDPTALFVFALLQHPEFGPRILELLEELIQAEEGGGLPPGGPMLPPEIPMGPGEDMPVPSGNRPFTRALLNRR